MKPKRYFRYGDLDVKDIRSKAERLFGALKGTITINGDIIKPLGESWEADE